MSYCYPEPCAVVLLLYLWYLMGRLRYRSLTLNYMQNVATSSNAEMPCFQSWEISEELVAVHQLLLYDSTVSRYRRSLAAGYWKGSLAVQVLSKDFSILPSVLPFPEDPRCARLPKHFRRWPLDHLMLEVLFLCVQPMCVVRSFQARS